MEKIPVLVIVGPTATGKSALAVEIAMNKNGEIINGDSMQIYKGLNIGTAKQTQDEMKGIPHHLIGIIEQSENFNLACYVELARKKIKDVHNRGKVPILVGGTGLYIDSVINNVNLNVVPQNLKLREDLIKKANVYGLEYLMNMLKKVDEEAANKIKINDVKRIIRALEINYITGKNVSDVYKHSNDVPKLYNTFIIGLNYNNRQLLYQKINNRVDKMVELGLIDEAKQLLKNGLSKTSVQAIGYKELENYFNNIETLENTIQKIKQNTRRYAKRQLTWFRKNTKINWVNIDEYENFRDVVNYCLKLLEKFLIK